MKLLVLNQSEIEQLLPMRDCITVMTDALIALAKGQVDLPLRMVVRPPGAAGVMALMPAHIAVKAPPWASRSSTSSTAILPKVRTRIRARCCCSILGQANLSP